MKLETFEGSVSSRIEALIVDRIPDAKVEVTGAGGHFSIVVVSQEFAGKSPVAKQRLVLTAITPLMSGANAPVHAVDSLKTLTP